ncbi:hypothetical protein [Sphingomonas sp. 8AM]|uniref:hypothetical protein n=1 Tax=Sphingomonas sp. 8AM TaxID=2653170 RepID=UPI0012F36293|nr:hypothetical protein [Sphingomonas sp. 8AM]VXC86824.1 hypothetical protein SPHINGO8AM_30358 [Sphingomonas sp. 8AM]
MRSLVLQNVVAAGIAAAWMQVAPVTQNLASSITGQSVIHAGIDYDSEGGTLRSCRLRRPTGDRDVDTAICELVRRCVAETPSSDGQTGACVRHRIAQLATLVDQGLLKTPTDQSGDGALDEVTVTAVRSPPPQAGQWRFSETGTRQQIAGGNYRELFKMVSLPPRYWRLCIRDDQLTAMLAAMLREDRYRTTASPCSWTVTPRVDHFEGTQKCTVRNALLRGRLTGSNDATSFSAAKETRITTLSSGLRLGGHAPLDASMPSSRERTADADDGREGGRGDPALGPPAFLERTVVEGHRIGTC